MHFYNYQVTELSLFNCGLPLQFPHGTSSCELPVLVGNDELTPVHEPKSYKYFQYMFIITVVTYNTISELSSHTHLTQ